MMGVFAKIMFNILNVILIDNSGETSENECNLTRALEKTNALFCFPRKLSVCLCCRTRRRFMQNMKEDT